MAGASNINFLNNDCEKFSQGGLPEGSDCSRSLQICPDHKAVLNLFCTSCVKGACYICIIEIHNGHPLDYHSVPTTLGLATRNALCWEMEEAISELTVGKRRMCLLQKSVEQKVDKAKKDIKSFIEKCHTALDQREQFLLRTLNLAYNDKKSRLDEKLSEIDKHLNSLLKSYDALYKNFSSEDPVKQASVDSEAGGLPEGSDCSRSLQICPDHKAVLNLFCTSCVKGACYICIIEIHNGHPLDYHSVPTTLGLATRNALCWEMEEAISELTVGKRRMCLLQKSVEQKVDKAKKDIKSFIEKCHTALDQREQFLLRTLNLAYNDKKSRLDEKLSEIDKHLNSLLKSYDALYKNFSSEDPVKQASVDSEAVRELNASRELSLVPVCSDSIHFWRDFSMKVRMRNYLGILGVGEELDLRQEEDGGYCSPGVSDSEVD